MKVRIVLEPSGNGGYTAFAPALPGCLGEGDSRDEALAHIQEAIELYLKPIEDHWDFAPDAEVLEIVV
jgi:predicted RNase H-like HicB family nuclease